MGNPSQISATISAPPKSVSIVLPKAWTEKKLCVEQALLYFMEARRDLPDEAFIPHVGRRR